MSTALIAFKVLLAIVLLASAPLALKRRWRLFLAIPLAVFQGFIPGMEVAGVPIPLAFWGGLMLWPELIREIRVVVTWKPTVYILGIVAMYTVSLLWSPSRRHGLQPIGYFVQFLIIFAAVVTEGRRDERLILRLLVVTAVMALVEAALVIVGRLSPGIKLAFYLSHVAKFVVSPNILAKIFTGSYNDVFDFVKSGGMFVNANVAATFLGLVACTALGLALHLRRKWLGVLGAVLLGSVAFTGSKAGLVLAVAVPVLMLHFISQHYRAWRNRLRMIMAAILIAGMVGWFGSTAIHVGETGTYAEVSSFLQRSHTTLSVREEIWQFGAQEFKRHPFEGLGFGGWRKAFPSYARKVGLPGDFPPEDTIIYLWSRGGALAALLGIAFIYEVLRIGWRQVRSRDAPAFGLSLAMTGAYLWTFVRGMGSNFGLLGDVHMSAILAALLALGYLQRQPHAQPSRTHSLDTEVDSPGGNASAYAARPSASLT